MKKLLFLLSLFPIMACTTAQVLPDPTPSPTPSGGITMTQAKGIYVLDSKAGTKTSSGISVRDGNIRSNSYIAGYAWRIAWSDLEIAQGVYDFSPLTVIVPKLQALNQKLTMVLAGQPAYIAYATPNAQYNFTDVDTGTPKAGMWDPYCLTRYQAFVNALAAFQVADANQGGALVPFSQHSVLAGIRGSICGQKSIRDDSNLPVNVYQLPGYTRALYENAITQSLGFVHTAFPNTRVTAGFWPVQDSVKTPMLWQDIQTMLSPNVSWLAYFQENLWASANTADKNDPNRVVTAGPPSNGTGQPLFANKATVPVFLQALQGWSAPFADPSKVLNATPGDGMKFAQDTYGAGYFELYVTDIDYAAYQAELAQWGSILGK